jgi:hypothetical protein
MNHVFSWSIVVFVVVAIALLFPPVRIWLRGLYLYWRGVDLARRATKFAEYRRVGQSLDQNYGAEKSRYKKRISKEWEKWGTWTKAPLEKRAETLKARLATTEKQQQELEEELREEKLHPSRTRIRVRDAFYVPAATLLFISDIGFTYLCVQVLGLSPLFIFPMALILGGASWFLGDALGKEIEPEVGPRTSDEKRKHFQSIIFLVSANVVICAIAGTIRFSYTRRELHGDMITTTVSSVQPQPHTNLGVDLISSYGILIAIILASVVLGWLHQSATTEERLAVVKKRVAQLELLIKRAERTGLRATESFQARIMALQAESAVLRARFHDGFDRTWKLRAPRGVQTPSSPLEGVDTILRGLTWPPTMQNIEWPQESAEIVDLERYYDPYYEQEGGNVQPVRTMHEVPHRIMPSLGSAPPSVATITPLPMAQSPQPRPVAAPSAAPPPPTIG